MRADVRRRACRAYSFTLISALALGGCSPTPESAESKAGVSAGAKVEDPAMAVAPSAPAPLPTETVSAAPAPVVVPTIPQLDATRENLFIPGVGWMPTDEFIRLYDNEPDKLPPDLDLVVIHDIREALRNRG